MADSTLAKPQNGWSSFFSNVGSGLSEGLRTIGSDVLPAWTANQLHWQRDDQLQDSTVNRSMWPQSWTNQWESIQNSMNAADDYAAFKKPVFTAGGLNVNALEIGGVIILLMMVYLIARR